MMESTRGRELDVYLGYLEKVPAVLPKTCHVTSLSLRSSPPPFFSVKLGCAMRHAGLNLHPPHWKLRVQPLDCQASSPPVPRLWNKHYWSLGIIVWKKMVMTLLNNSLPPIEGLVGARHCAKQFTWIIHGSIMDTVKYYKMLIILF